jgi:hypothetical protein
MDVGVQNEREPEENLPRIGLLTTRREETS